MSSRVAPFGYPRINGYLLLPEAFRSLSRPSSAPDAKAFPLRSFQLDLSLFSQRLVREFLVLFENYAGFTKIEIVCHPASFRMLFHNQFVSSVSPQRNLSVALLAFVTLFSFQGADRRPQASACLRHSFQPLLQSDLKIRSFDQVFKSKGKSPGGPEWARTTDLTIISRTLSPAELRALVLDEVTLYSLGGDSRVRTGDLLLARQALSQLSYIPFYLPAYAL